MTPTLTADSCRTALFPGSFRPFTSGHADIVARALEIFDRVVIAVGINSTKGPADADAAAEAIRRLYAADSRVYVCTYAGLTVSLAESIGAKAVVRGVRNVKDFEYERDMADINRQLSGIETVIFFSRPELAAVSSSVVRELESFGIDASQFLPSQPI